MDPLPPDTTLTTADAVSMYSNIDPDHGITTIAAWLKLHKKELPIHFPVEAVIEGLCLVMSNNVFQFGDTHWLQKSGTAMGTSVACMYATIYFSYHEETQIIPPSHNHNLLLYQRYINDALIIQATPNKTTATAHADLLTCMNSFGEMGQCLTWTSEEPSKSVNFLDLTITLKPNGTFTTATYQKPMNLYLYLPWITAHPPQCPPQLYPQHTMEIRPPE